MHRGGIISLRTSWLNYNFMVDVIVGLVKWQDVCAKDPDLSDLGSHALGESITGIPKMVVEGPK